MTYDEQHGWVERGTRGVHSGAVVRDVREEKRVLWRFAHRTSIDGYWWPDGRREQNIARLNELVPIYEAVRDRREGFRSEAHNERRRAKDQALASVNAKLALLAPYIAILRAGDEKRQRDAARRMTYAGFDVGRDGGTVMTTYAVEGDTLRVVHTARMPLPAQTVNVTMTIGGE